MNYPCFVLLQVFVKARQRLGEILSAFEFFDQQALDLTLKHLEGIRNPLPDTQTPFYLVVETSGSNEEHDNEKLQVRLAIQRLYAHRMFSRQHVLSLAVTESASQYVNKGNQARL